MLTGIIGIDDEGLSDEQFVLLEKLVVEQLEQRIPGRNVQFSKPLREDRVAAIAAATSNRFNSITKKPNGRSLSRKRRLRGPRAGLRPAPAVSFGIAGTVGVGLRPARGVKSQHPSRQTRRGLPLLSEIQRAGELPLSDPTRSPSPPDILAPSGSLRAAARHR